MVALIFSTSPLTLISSQPNLLSLRVGVVDSVDCNAVVILFAYTDATGEDGNDFPRFASFAIPIFCAIDSVSFDSKFNFKFSTVRQSERFFTRFPHFNCGLFLLLINRLFHVIAGRLLNNFSEYCVGDDDEKRLFTVANRSDSYSIPSLLQRFLIRCIISLEN